MSSSGSTVWHGHPTFGTITGLLSPPTSPESQVKDAQINDGDESMDVDGVCAEDHPAVPLSEAPSEAVSPTPPRTPPPTPPRNGRLAAGAADDAHDGLPPFPKCTDESLTYIFAPKTSPHASEEPSMAANDTANLISAAHPSTSLNDDHQEMPPTPRLSPRTVLQNIDLPPLIIPETSINRLNACPPFKSLLPSPTFDDYVSVSLQDGSEKSCLAYKDDGEETPTPITFQTRSYFDVKSRPAESRVSNQKPVTVFWVPTEAELLAYEAGHTHTDASARRAFADRMNRPRAEPIDPTYFNAIRKTKHYTKKDNPDFKCPEDRKSRNHPYLRLMGLRSRSKCDRGKCELSCRFCKADGLRVRLLNKRLRLKARSYRPPSPPSPTWLRDDFVNDPLFPIEDESDEDEDDFMDVDEDDEDEDDYDYDPWNPPKTKPFDAYTLIVPAGTEPEEMGSLF